MQKAKVISTSVVDSVVDIADATAIPLLDFDGAILLIPADANNLTSVTWYVSDDNTTYYALNSSADEAVVQTVAEGEAYHINPVCNAGHYLKLVGDAATTIKVMLKRMG